jgi:dTDP-glucose 4,6-dehydratase
LADTVRTLANICDNFKPGEVYNIGGEQYHSIEELSEMILEITKANPDLAIYKDSEPFTTRVKKVDISKSIRDLKHRNTYDLKAGLQITADWMRSVYSQSIQKK